MKSSHILGLNARNHLYQSRYNAKKGKRIADSKLLTKRFLAHLKIPHPRLIASFKTPGEAMRFDWGSLSENFVIKPASGYAGEGILLVRRRMSNDSKLNTQNSKLFGYGLLGTSGQAPGTTFQLMDGSTMSLRDLKLHVLDILEGRFDKYDLPGTVIIEERVIKHPRFKRYAYQGTPDVRVILFNKVPVMAMLRLPTPESRGRANLHQGAIGVGIDLATGITTKAVRWDKPISTLPDLPAEKRAMSRERIVRAVGERQAKAGTNLKLNGIDIPSWDRILELSAEIADRIDLGYFAVDFLIDPEKGPLVVELTCRPGLGIQIANTAGLKRRLERVEGLDIEKGKGIEVAKALFAERFADKIIAERGIKVIGVFESARVRSTDNGKREVPAKVDTGAFRTSIDKSLAQELGLMKDRSVLWHDYYQSALGRERRPIIPLVFWIGGRKIETTANVSDRSKLKEKLLVGRRDLGTFLVRPGGV
jgi:hypothetical protein